MKNAAQKGDAPPLSSTTISRTGSPAPTSESPRRSIDVRSSTSDERPIIQVIDTETGGDVSDSIESQNEELPPVVVEPATLIAPEISNGLPEPEGQETTLEVEEAPRVSLESAHPHRRQDSDVSRQQTPEPRASREATRSNIALDTLKRSTGAVPALTQSDVEALELQRQEEAHGYVERIDALQAKLQYLAKESAESAKKASTSAPAGSLDKKLADKDEQIALLMEEGQQLSKKELHHLTTIKKLRAGFQQNAKEVSDAKIKQQKAHQDVSTLTERLKRAEGSEKRLNERLKAAEKLYTEVDSLKAEREKKDVIIYDLKTQLDNAKTQEKESEARLANEELVKEKRRVAELEDDLANSSIEKSLAADRAKAQLRELSEKLDKQTESARMAKLETKAEQQMLESKLEVMRARAEEASSGATGDAQAKLLRQIETLQTQYAVASENWQGIEASMVARSMNLEKERDEANRREADIRRKARELVRFSGPKTMTSIC